MICIGLDPATSCGWAMLYPDGSRIGSGAWDLRVLRGEGDGMRFIRLRGYLRELISSAEAMGQGVLVGYEDIKRHRSARAGHVYGGLVSHVLTVCEDMGVQAVPVPWEDIKILATGRAKAKKPEMIATANERWGIEVLTDDEADALWCALAVTKWGSA